MSRTPNRLSVLSAVAVALVGVASCGSSANKGASTPSSSTSTAAPSASTSTTPTAQEHVALFLLQGERLVAAGRSVPAPAGPDAAVKALLRGPQGALERDLHITTAIPTGTTLHRITVSGSTALVDLSKRFEAGGGSLSMQQRAAQVVWTVTQFGGVSKVNFALDGTPVQSIGGEGLMVQGLTRTSLPDVLPAILVESPTIGEQVASPLEVYGTSSTFEAVVNYTLTDPDGLILKEGAVHATSGTGTWGTFSFEVPFTAKRPGFGSLIVYEISAKDGARINLREIPIQMTAPTTSTSTTIPTAGPAATTPQGAIGDYLAARGHTYIGDCSKASVPGDIGKYCSILRNDGATARRYLVGPVASEGDIFGVARAGQGWRVVSVSVTPPLAP